MSDDLTVADATQALDVSSTGVVYAWQDEADDQQVSPLGHAAGAGRSVVAVAAIAAIALVIAAVAAVVVLVSPAAPANHYVIRTAPVEHTPAPPQLDAAAEPDPQPQAVPVYPQSGVRHWTPAPQPPAAPAPRSPAADQWDEWLLNNLRSLGYTLLLRQLSDNQRCAVAPRTIEPRCYPVSLP